MRREPVESPADRALPVLEQEEADIAIKTAELEAICGFAIALTVEAGAMVARHYEKVDPRLTYDKGVNDLVTPVDREVEAFLKGRLAKMFPDFGFVGEETGGMPDPDGVFWVVDPIDGTTNFAHGFPYFCVSLALNEGRETVLGAVYDPLRREVFRAVRGRGAFRDAVPIRCAPRNTLVSALIASGFPNRALRVLPRYETIYRRCLQAGAGIRRTGSAALDLAHIAAGRMDGTFQFGISLWDYAAGALLVSEAGGKVVTLPDADSGDTQTHIFAGSSFVVDRLLAFDAQKNDSQEDDRDA